MKHVHAIVTWTSRRCWVAATPFPKPLFPNDGGAFFSLQKREIRPRGEKQQGLNIDGDKQLSVLYRSRPNGHRIQIGCAKIVCMLSAISSHPEPEAAGITFPLRFLGALLSLEVLSPVLPANNEFLSAIVIVACHPLVLLLCLPVGTLDGVDGIAFDPSLLLRGA